MTNAQGEVTLNADIAAAGGTVTFDAATVNLNVDIVSTSKASTTDLDTINVAATAKIQHAIDISPFNIVPDTTTINVAAGTFNESLVVNKNVSIVGSGSATTHLNAGFATNGIDVQSGSTASVSGIELSNFFSTGVRVAGNLHLFDSDINGGLIGVWVDGGNLEMDTTLISGVGVFGVQVGGGFADIDNSEITGTATTAAAIIVSAGTRHDRWQQSDEQ